ncbi:hypothetical protein [Streptomyces sp. NPDC006739]|uniref:hypothetical protein n=1 Tax=Streptomyces sp. NPDC006739 TaxID=3364763 RepID=UPI00368F1AB8
MRRSHRAVTALAATVLTAAGTLAAAAPQAAAANQYYRTWATHVNVRVSNADPDGCGRYPSVATCPDVRGQVEPGTDFYVYCQGHGQTVGGNPYWLMIGTETMTGWMASYYVDYPSNRLPDVPDCPGQAAP